jgi:hypothetical protein
LNPGNLRGSLCPFLLHYRIQNFIPKAGPVPRCSAFNAEWRLKRFVCCDEGHATHSSESSFEVRLRNVDGAGGILFILDGTLCVEEFFTGHFFVGFEKNC